MTTTKRRLPSSDRRDARTSLRPPVNPRRVAACLGALVVLASSYAAADAASRGSALPPPRETAATTFTLGIEAVLPTAVIDQGTVSPAAFLEPEAAMGAAAELSSFRLAELDLGAAREPTFLRRQQSSPSESAPARGGFGRWLKRHWWVPVLGAAAIGYAVSESGGDDDRFGEDD